MTNLDSILKSRDITLPTKGCLVKAIVFPVDWEELRHMLTSLFFLFFKFYFILKLYIIVLVLPNIKMNPPQVYMCSHPEPSSLFPPRTIPLGRPSAPAPSIQYRASNLDW